MDRLSPKVLALLALLTLVWGTNWPLFRIALNELPVLTFRTITMITAIAVLIAILMVRGESFAVPKGKWPALIAASAMNILVWNIATSLAVLYIPSGHASVLAYTMPLWVALIGFAVFGQRLTGRLLAALLIGAAAVVALMVPNFASYEQRAGRPVLGPVRGLLLGDRHLHRQAHERGRAWACRSPSGRSSSACRRSCSARWRSTHLPARWPSARRPRRHDLYRRHPNGAGHRHLVRPGQDVADPGRRPVLDRHPDRRHRKRHPPPRTSLFDPAGGSHRLDGGGAVARPDAGQAALAEGTPVAWHMTEKRGLDTERTGAAPLRIMKWAARAAAMAILVLLPGAASAQTLKSSCIRT